jgi:hypothetical protein
MRLREPQGELEMGVRICLHLIARTDWLPDCSFQRGTIWSELKVSQAGLEVLAEKLKDRKV